MEATIVALYYWHMCTRTLLIILFALLAIPVFGQIEELAVTTDGTIWVARDGQLFTVRDNKATPVSAYQQKARITDLLADKTGGVLVASDQGLLRCDVKSCTPDSRVAAGIDVESISTDGNGHLWLSTRASVGKLRDGSVQEMLKTFAQALAVDSSGAMWIGSGHEVIRWENGKTKIYPLPAPAANVRMMPPITSILPVEGGKIFVGTRQGLLSLNGGTFERVADLDVLALAKDNQGAILIGTADGLKRMADGKISNIPL